jgi:hypothetical protein
MVQYSASHGLSASGNSVPYEPRLSVRISLTTGQSTDQTQEDRLNKCYRVGLNEKWKIRIVVTT